MLVIVLYGVCYGRFSFLSVSVGPARWVGAGGFLVAVSCRVCLGCPGSRLACPPLWPFFFWCGCGRRFPLGCRRRCLFGPLGCAGGFFVLRSPAGFPAGSGLVVCVGSGLLASGSGGLVVASSLPFVAGASAPVALAGSRQLPPRASALVARVVRSLLRSGCSLAVGCASGSDAAVLSAAVAAGGASRVSVFVAFGPSGLGACSASAPSAVAAAAAAGSAVTWWAGGSASVPLHARLPARTGAVVASAGALVVFFSSPCSRGSALAARRAAARGLPVVAFPLHFAASQLPSLGAGRWVPTRGFGPWRDAWLWSSVQSDLF